METFLPIIVLVAFLWLMYSREHAKSKALTAARIAAQNALNAAKDAYAESLSKLTSDPTNATLRQDTLDKGRKYANLTRENKGVTVFDEMALMNDINAACGGITALAAPDNSPRPGTPSLQDRLARLEQLKAQGLVTDSEYQSKRAELLAEI